jgi:hypothetical protein
VCQPFSVGLLTTQEVGGLVSLKWAGHVGGVSLSHLGLKNFTQWYSVIFSMSPLAPCFGNSLRELASGNHFENLLHFFKDLHFSFKWTVALVTTLTPIIVTFYYS